MKRLSNYGVCIGLLFSLAACGTSSGVLSFDELNPAALTFPPAVRSVGIVNSVSVPTQERRLFEQEGMVIGNGKEAVGELAKALASTRYFDEVVLADAPYLPPGQQLTQTGIDSLANAMQVDMVILLDRLPISLQPTQLTLPDTPPIPAIISVCEPELRFFQAGQPLNQSVTFARKDSIYLGRQGMAVNLRELKEEATYTAIQRLIPAIVPTWSPAERIFFINGNADFRDAQACLHKKDWAGAIDICQQLYNTTGESTERARAAYNLAVINERINRIDDAQSWIGLALKEVKTGTEDASVMTAYAQHLQRRKTILPQLQQQMMPFSAK